jgi:hypothetical protein
MLDRRISQRPWLEIFNNYPDITAELRKIDKGYFIVKNNLSKELEVHNKHNTGPETFCFTVPYPLLDARTIDYCRRTYLPHRGREIIKNMDRHNESVTKSKEKSFDSHIHDVSVDTAKDLVFAAEKDMLHDGYKRTHTVS